jgi:phage terminase Nu1 subunit (DNA packaging protein)
VCGVCYDGGSKTGNRKFHLRRRSRGRGGCYCLEKGQALDGSSTSRTSISTLADSSAAAAREYELAGIAELQRETEEANLHLSRASQFLQKLKGTMGVEVATPLPAFIRHK